MTSKILLKDLISKVWRNIGYNMNFTSLGMNLAPVIGFIIMCCVAGFGLLNLFLTEASIPNIADAFESTGPYSQLFVKVCLTRYKVKLIRHLLTEIEEKFWPIDKFGRAIKEKQLKTFRIIDLCMKGYIVCIYPCIMIMICKPFFYEERMFPLQVYTLFDISNNYYYVTNYCIQIFGFFYVTGSLLAIDGLFALYVVNVLCQLTMLQFAFHDLDIENITKNNYTKKYEKLMKYVDHHDLILRFILKIQDIYSVQLFFQFVGNTASICMGVYIVSSAGMKDIATSIRAAFIVIVWFCQLSVYCVGGTLLTEACGKVAFSMYDSNWEGQYSAKFRYGAQMVIMQAQKPKIMMAGKIFDINLSSFSGIVRLAVSLYTLMNKVQNKKL